MLDASHSLHVPILPTGTFNIFYEKFDLAVLSLNLFFHAGCLFIIIFFKRLLGEKESSYLREVFWKKYFLTELTNAYDHSVAKHKNYPL